VWPTEDERQQVYKALHERDVTKLTLVAEIGSPWLQIDAWVHMEGELKLALWRATGAVYALDSRGAVEEDAMVKGAWTAL
jgi:hypothetical protein